MTMDIFTPEDQTPEEQLKHNRKRLISIFKREITDPNMRKMIFGTAVDDEEELLDVLCKTKMFPLYFKNILTMAFYYTYACYCYVLETGSTTLDNPSNIEAKRIKKCLKDTLLINAITMGYMEFVMTDVQIELAKGSDSDLKPMLGKLGNFDQGFTFHEMLASIIDYEKNHSRIEAGKLELTSLFLDIVDNLSFLRTYCLVEDSPYQFRFITKLCKEYREDDESYKASPYDELKLEHLLLRQDDRFYRLHSIEKGEVGETKRLIIRLSYVAIRDERPLTFTLPQDEGEPPHHLSGFNPQEIYEYIVSSELDPHQSARTAGPNEMSISQIHAINYKYLKHLALAISDTLSKFQHTQDVLRRKFANIYPYLFDKRQNNDPFVDAAQDEQDDTDWDSVILMLLIEASPTAVLETIIRTDTGKDKPLFCSLGRDLYKRVYNAEGMALFNRPAAEIVQAVRAIIRKKLIVGEAGGFGKLPKGNLLDTKLFPKAAAILLLAQLDACSEKTREEDISYTGNLSNNITFLKREADEETDPIKKIRYASIILSETLKHIMCFYAGLEKYGERKIPFDAEARYHPLSESAVQIALKKLYKAFLTGATACAKSLPSTPAETTPPADALALLQRFVDFCNGFSQANDAAKSKHLNAAIGRFEIVDISRFNHLTQRLRAIDTRSISDATATEWVAVTLDILEFFKSGSTPDRHMDGDLLNAVYPFTAMFNKGRVNLDGYETITFSLNLDPDEDDKGHEINVLSEFQYNHHEVYHCLPNVTRSNFKWWIDPVLISFRDFNRIFEEMREEDN